MVAERLVLGTLLLCCLVFSVQSSLFSVESQTFVSQTNSIQGYGGFAQSFNTNNGFIHLYGVQLCLIGSSTYGSGSATLSIRSTSSLINSTTALASETIVNPNPDGFLLFAFDRPAIMEPNTTYYIHIQATNPRFELCIVQSSGGTAYRNGQLYFNTSTPNPTVASSYDAGFQTVVDLPFISIPDLKESQVITGERFSYPLIIEAHPTIGATNLLKTITQLSNNSLVTQFEFSPVYGNLFSTNTSAKTNLLITPNNESISGTVFFTVQVADPNITNNTIVPSSYQDSFPLLVLGSSGAPVITSSTFNNTNFIVSTTTTDLDPIYFTVGDFDTPDENLTIEIMSSDPSILPASLQNLFDCDEDKQQCLILLTRLQSNPSGNVTVSVTVTDELGQSSTLFLHFNIEDFPVIYISTLEVDLYDYELTAQPIFFNVTDKNHPGEVLNVTATFVGRVTVASVQVMCNNDKSGCYLMYNLTGRYGQSLITLTATDPDGGSSSQFILITASHSIDYYTDGACCLNNSCLDTSLSDCNRKKGLFYLGAICNSNICPGTPSPSRSVTLSQSPLVEPSTIGNVSTGSGSVPITGKDTGGDGLSGGAIAGIVIGVIVGVLLILALIVVVVVVVIYVFKKTETSELNLGSPYSQM